MTKGVLFSICIQHPKIVAMFFRHSIKLMQIFSEVSILVYVEECNIDVGDIFVIKPAVGSSELL